MSRGMIIVDAGHGPLGNPYPLLDGVFEGTRNFVLASFLKKELEVRGFEVVLTRPRLEDEPSLEERGRMAGKLGAALFLSLHSNAPGSATPPDLYHRIRGCEVFYSLADEENNARLALALCEAVATCMHTENRGTMTRTYPDQPGVDYYGVLRHSAASGCKRALLIEHGFHTNPADGAFLADDVCMARLATAEATVIDRML